MDIAEGLQAFFSNSVSNEEKTLSSKSHSELYSMRESNKDNPDIQNKLAPYEHRAFAREWVGDTGPLAAASLAVAIPVYVAAKATGIEQIAKDTGVLENDGQQATSNYSQEMKQGFIGIGEGLSSYFQTPNTKQAKAAPQNNSGDIASLVDKYNQHKQTVDSLLPFLIDTESSGKHTNEDGSLTTSSEGAKGITQVMPKTAKNPGYGITPLQNDTQEEYMRFGRDYLSTMLRVFDDEEQALAAYNAGPGAVHRAISKAGRTGNDWKEYIPRETQKYIEKITSKKEVKEKQT